MRKLVLALFCFSSASVLADVTMTFDDGTILMISDRYVAIGDQQAKAVFEADKDTFLMVDHDEQTYMEMSETFAEDVSAMMAAQMEQMLAEVPPEQRAMFEQSMKDMMPGGAAMPEPPTMIVNKTGNTDTVAGFSCSEVEVSYGSGRPEELSCVATTSELGITRKDFESMSNAMRSVSRMAGMEDDGESLMDFNAMGGVPIRTRDLVSGDEDVLVSLSKDDIDEAAFAVPPGYRKVSMDDLMRQ